MTTRFTDELMEQGLTYKVLTLLSQIDVNNEFEKLQRERGLGSEKHRKEVSDLIKECRQSLAESLLPGLASHHYPKMTPSYLLDIWKE